MAAKKLKQENDALKEQVQQLTNEVSTLKQAINKVESPTQRDDANRHDDGTAKGSRSIEVSSQDIQFYGDMNDDLNSFRQTAIKKLQLIEEKL